MTGIFLFYKKNQHKWPKNLRTQANKLKHRGNEQVKTVQNASFFGKFFINHAQRDNYEQFHTIKTQDGNLLLEVVDGSIYNMVSIMNITLKSGHYPHLFLLDAYKQIGLELFTKLKGPFAILMKSKKEIIIARDPVGTKPIYLLNSNKALIISSELKSISNFVGVPEILEPGTVFIYDFITDNVRYEKFFNLEQFLNAPILKRVNVFTVKKKLYKMLEIAVKKSINVPCKIGALLSGGIDSTVICAIAQKFVPDLNIYTVVAENSSDLSHAIDFTKMYPNTQHHIYNLKIEDLLQVVPDVIYHLETFDAPLIRSALPMYYLTSKVDEMTGLLLTGEGGDELFGGYNYFKNLSDTKLRNEFVKLLKIEHATGLQRVDRIPYAFQLEARAPWFDINIVKFAFSLPMNLKIYKSKDILIEKWIIRETFKDIIPKSVFNRKKAKFSEGVGSQFLLRDYCNEQISDEEFNQNKEISPGIFVNNKEELYYWRIFSSLFQPKKDFIENLPRTEVWIY
ncbi:MAG: hypothetical protein EU530_11065 [Promethearchaeota archaeon]|nr:MAG: hypothetical protein EU530_11065 [Candidatus Lokiarchaeota archaeon]